MVLAGKFRALKIKLLSTHMGVWGGHGYTKTGTAYIWYSPEVKNIVKIEFEKTGHWIGYEDYELVSFKPKDKDVFLSKAELEKKEIEKIPDKFSYLMENGVKMIRENEYENVLYMIGKLPSEKKWDFRIKVLENFANLKGFVVTKRKEYGKEWKIFYKPMVLSGNKIATPILVEFLKEDDPYMRDSAAKVLAYLGDKRALEELKRLADQDPYSKVRARAKWAYDQISAGGPPKEPVVED